MKTNLSILTILMIAACCGFSQTPLKLVKERVGNPDILKNWEVGDVKYVNDVAIQRLEGENNYDFITNVFYMPQSKILQLVEEKAKVEALTSAERELLVERYESAVSGGQIALFFSRPTKALAEPENFSIKVLDENGNTLYSCALGKEQPYYYRWEIWYYYKNINLPVEAGETFTIKIDDAGGRKSYKFRVSRQQEATMPLPGLTLKPTLF